MNIYVKLMPGAFLKLFSYTTCLSLYKHSYLYIKLIRYKEFFFNMQLTQLLSQGSGNTV